MNDDMRWALGRSWHAPGRGYAMITEELTVFGAIYHAEGHYRSASGKLKAFARDYGSLESAIVYLKGEGYDCDAF